MSKRARRLWLGDWQRDQAAEPVQEDTVTILPDEDEAVEVAPRNDQRRNRQRVVATAAAATVLAALALTLLNGGNDNNSRTTAQETPPARTFQAQPQVPQQQIPPGAGGGFGGADLTGPAATKAAEAALSKFPGDIERVTAGPGGAGGYVVHVIQGDGNEVHVVVSDEFKVLGSDAGRGGFGGGAPPSSSGNSS